MSLLPQLRKNVKFFANGKNAPLVELSTMVQDGEEVVSVEAVANPKERNTLLVLVRDNYPTYKDNPPNVSDSERYTHRNIMYNRMSLNAAFRLAFEDVDGAFKIDAEIEYEHPLSTVDFIKVINNKYGYDVTEDDITVTSTGSNAYTVAAKPYSLCFFGIVSVSVGKKPDNNNDKTPSHDALWNNTSVDLTTAALVNNQPVILSNAQAVFNAGLAYKQWSDPSTAWFINLSPVDTVITVTTNEMANISEYNINETLSSVGLKATAKLSSFTVDLTPPPFENPVKVVDQSISFNLAFNHPATIDKLLTIWVDNVIYPFTDLVAGRHPDLIILNQGDVYSIVQADKKAHQVSIRTAVPTLPSLINRNLRVVSGITNDGLQIPFDETGRELYSIEFPEVIEIVVNDSVMTPVVVTDASIFTTALSKVNPSLGLTYSQYQEANPTLIFNQVEARWYFTANTQTETYPNKFPTFYLISDEDWEVIATQPANTLIGYVNRTNGVSRVDDLTVGTLAANSIGTPDGRLLVFLNDLAIHHNATISVDYDVSGPFYRSTNLMVRLDVNYSKASLIAPVALDTTILRKFYDSLTQTQFDSLVALQQSTTRTITETDGVYSVEFKFSPIASGANTQLLQLIKVPKVGFDLISNLAVVSPNTVVIKRDVAGTVTNVTARNFIQNSQVDADGNAYLLFIHDKTKPATQKLIYNVDFDGTEAAYRESATTINLNNVVIDLPLIPFNVELDEYQNETDYNKATSLIIGGPYLGWDDKTVLISIPQPNTHDQLGSFTRFGLNDYATVARVTLPSALVTWLNTNTLLTANDVICKYTDGTTEQSVTLKQIKDTLIDNSFGIKLLPVNGKETVKYTFEFKWYGFNKDPRPPLTTYPNFENGTCTLELELNVIEPINNVAGFEFVTTTDEIYSSLLGLMNVPVNDFAAPGKLTRSVTDTQEISTGVYGQNLIYRYNFTSPSTKVLKVIRFDKNFYDRLMNVSNKETVVFSNGVDNITIAYLQSYAVVNTETVFVPVEHVIEQPDLLSSAEKGSETWVSDYSSINTRDEKFISLTNIATLFVYDDTIIPTEFDVVAPNTDFDWVEWLIANQGGDVSSYLNIQRMFMSVNSSGLFGQWTYNRKDYGKNGYIGIKFKGIYGQIIKNIPVSDTSTIVSVTVKGKQNGQLDLNYLHEFNREQMIQMCDLENVGIDEDFYVLIPLPALQGVPSYEMVTKVDIDGTSVKFDPTTKTTLITITDNTPDDVDVTIKGETTATQSVLDTWKQTSGINNTLTTSLYNVVSVDDTNLTREVDPKAATLEVPFAISLSDNLLKYLNDEALADSVVIGKWNGVDLKVADIKNGYNSNGKIYLFTKHTPDTSVTEHKQRLVLDYVGVAKKDVTVTLIETPIIASTKLAVKRVIESWESVIANLTKEFNPVVDQLIPYDLIDLVVNDDTDQISITLNNIPHDYVGKAFVIPVALEKDQLDVSKPTTSNVARISINGATATNVRVSDYVLRGSEGWYWDNDGKTYFIHPVTITISESLTVREVNVTVNANVGGDDAGDYFIPALRNVKLSYTTLPAVVTFADIVFADNLLLESVLPVGMTRNDYLSDSVVYENSKIGNIDIKKTDLIWETNKNKLIPLFMIADKSQFNKLSELPNTHVVGSLLSIYYTYNQGAGRYDELDRETRVLTKQDFLANRELDGKLYVALNKVYNGTTASVTHSLTLDFDDIGGNWLPTTKSTGYKLPDMKRITDGLVYVRPPVDQEEYDNLVPTPATNLATYTQEKWNITEGETAYNVTRERNINTFEKQGLLVVEISGAAAKLMGEGYFAATDVICTIKPQYQSDVVINGATVSKGKFVRDGNGKVLSWTHYIGASPFAQTTDGIQNFNILVDSKLTLTAKKTELVWGGVNPNLVVQPTTQSQFDAYVANLVNPVATFGSDYTVTVSQNTTDNRSVYNVNDFQRSAIGKELLLSVAIDRTVASSLLTGDVERVVGYITDTDLVTEDSQPVKVEIREKHINNAMVLGRYTANKVIVLVDKTTLLDKQVKGYREVNINGYTHTFEYNIKPKALVITGKLEIRPPVDQADYDSVRYLNTLGQRFADFKDELWVYDTSGTNNIIKRRDVGTNRDYLGLLVVELTGEILEYMDQGIFDPEEGLINVSNTDGQRLLVVPGSVDNNRWEIIRDTNGKPVKAITSMSSSLWSVMQGEYFLTDFRATIINPQVAGVTFKSTDQEWYTRDPSLSLEGLSQTSFDKFKSLLTAPVAEFGEDYTLTEETNDDDNRVVRNIKSFSRAALDKNFLYGVSVDKTYCEQYLITGNDSRVIGTTSYYDDLAFQRVIVDKDITEADIKAAIAANRFTNDGRLLLVNLPVKLLDGKQEFVYKVTIDGYVVKYRIKSNAKTLITCDGAKTSTERMDLDGPYSLEIDDETVLTFSTLEEVVQALRDNNFEVTIIPDPVEISCEGATNDTGPITLDGKFLLEVDGELKSTTPYSTTDGTLVQALEQSGLNVDVLE